MRRPAFLAPLVALFAGLAAAIRGGGPRPAAPPARQLEQLEGSRQVKARARPMPEGSRRAWCFGVAGRGFAERGRELPAGFFWKRDQGALDGVGGRRWRVYRVRLA